MLAAVTFANGKRRTLKWLGASALLLAVAPVALWYEPDLALPELWQRYADSRSQLVDIDGMPVHYRVEGDGPDLLLLHGTGASLHTWEGWVRELRADFRVISVDLPGFGLTGPDPERDYSSARYVAFVRSFADAIGLESFHLAGNSLGGQIAWHFALAHPAAVDRLILVDASGHPSREKRNASFVFRMARTPVINRLFTVITPRWIHRRSIFDVYGDPAKVTDALVDRYFDLSLRAGNRQAFIDRARLDHDDETRDPRQIGQPTLIIWGALDRWIPLDQGEAFAADIANAELVVFDGAGHIPMEELPLETARIVREFLRD